MHTLVGDVIQPLMKLHVEIVEIAKAATEEEVFAHVAERALHPRVKPEGRLLPLVCARYGRQAFGW